MIILTRLNLTQDFEQASIAYARKGPPSVLVVLKLLIVQVINWRIDNLLGRFNLILGPRVLRRIGLHKLLDVWHSLILLGLCAIGLVGGLLTYPDIKLVELLSLVMEIIIISKC
jgi:hypothetical protein